MLHTIYEENQPLSLLKKENKTLAYCSAFLKSGFPKVDYSRYAFCSTQPLEKVGPNPLWGA
jgi:hypothetical protein